MSDLSQRFQVAKGSLKLIVRFLAAALILAFLPFTFTRILGYLLFILGAFSLYFFRDPERRIMADPSTVLSPGDGRVLEVAEESNSVMGGKARVIRIFLSIFNVHVQRAPQSGIIRSVKYRKGKFLDARNPRAWIENEQNSIVIENDRCKMVVVQIAGFVARRIDSWVVQEEPVKQGQRLGLIRFGSQVDLILPMDFDVCVSRGDKVEGGLSIVAISKRKA